MYTDPKYEGMELSNADFHLYTYEGERFSSHGLGANDPDGPGSWTAISVAEGVDESALAANIYFLALQYCCYAHGISDQEVSIMYDVMLNKLKAPYYGSTGPSSDSDLRSDSTPPWESNQQVD